MSLIGLYQAVEPDAGQDLKAFQYGWSVPDVWRTPLREGSRQIGQSVSSIFAIQWRSQSGYYQIGMLVLDPTIQLIDWLIVDAKNGGVGFRNNKVPMLVHEYGSTWIEDILFVEPETHCAELNFTFVYHLSQISTLRPRPRSICSNATDSDTNISTSSKNFMIDCQAIRPTLTSEAICRCRWTRNPVTGRPRRRDEPQSGSRWAVSVYNCASSIRATIRTVAFQYNGTGLADFKVTSASQKTYPSPSDHPVWVVRHGHLPLGFAQPLWGLLGYSDVTTPHNPVPLARDSEPQHRHGRHRLHLVQDGQKLPGVDFYVKALQNTFTVRRGGDVGYESYPGYSGLTGLALYHNWQNLSATTDGAV
ncbi:hypothetical protein N657DRAFT_670038 [Parathielavia appendiculata]|uniref:Uncharacterized protein n=1 Tax=Parathielavia appendiculata TaxID=2587402 RepID=A0AAN6U4K7_9PEZI|nr:hypothetical protein N657DRAFT_670038 [Parathielavia appendiculata]